MNSIAAGFIFLPTPLSGADLVEHWETSGRVFAQAVPDWARREVPGLAESEIGKIVGYIEMGHPFAPALSDEQVIALNFLWKLLYDSMAFRLNEEATADLNSSWWCHVSGLAKKALQALNRPVQAPAFSARALLDKWSLGEYSEEFPR